MIGSRFSSAALGALILAGSLAASGAAFAASGPTASDSVTTSASLSGTHPSTFLLVGLRIGDRGHAVYTLQTDLRILGYRQVGPVDGIYGPKTQRAVRAFERHHGIRTAGATSMDFRNAVLVSMGVMTEEQARASHRTDAVRDLEAAHPAVAQYLRDGSRNHWVATLQADLGLVGYGAHLNVDGVFGTATKAAVASFQKAHNLAVTGTSTPSTWHALLAALGLVAPYHGGQVPTTTTTASSSLRVSQSATTSQAHSSRSSATSSVAPTVTTQSTPTATTTQSTSKTRMIDGRPVLQVIHMIATAYGPSLQDNYPYGPVDAFGQPLAPGMVAVDPSVIPLHTYVYVSGYTDQNLPSGGFLGHAMDTGGAIKGDRIDIFMNANARTVSNFGIEPVTVYVLGK